MARQRFSDIIKGAAEVNLRYSASLLNLSKDYLREFTRAITSEGEEPLAQAEGPQETARPQQPVLILAGRKGEQANAAFAVNNTSQMSGSVSLSTKGDFAGTRVVTDPEILSLKNGEGCIIRILADISEKMPVDVDHPGAVIIPELGIHIAEFIIRRLPDLPVKKKSARKRRVAGES